MGRGEMKQDGDKMDQGENPKLEAPLPSDHFNGTRFFNPNADTRKSFADFLKWQVTAKREPWPKWVDVSKLVPREYIPSLSEGPAASATRVFFINHSTFLIQSSGINVLTDPVYSKRVSPLSWLGPARVHSPGIAFENLPQIHAVLVSHNHYDHLDIETLVRLHHQFGCKFYVAWGDAQLLRSRGITNVYQMDWWQNLQFNSALQIHFLPALHWSGRGLADRHQSLWGSFWIKFTNHQIYFAGDSGYTDHFRQIYTKLGAPDLSLLPIGAYEPRWFMRASHMNPAEAVQAHLDLKSRRSLGMHFGTFRLTDEGINDPVTALHEACVQKSFSQDEFVAPLPGQCFIL